MGMSSLTSDSVEINIKQIFDEATLDIEIYFVEPSNIQQRACKTE